MFNVPQNGKFDRTLSHYACNNAGCIQDSYLYKLSTQRVLSHQNKVHKVQVSEKYVQTTR